ncbi:uncharacterized protein B4U80_14640, partial [Leptotrombidium deliense]
MISRAVVDGTKFGLKLYKELVSLRLTVFLDDHNLRHGHNWIRTVNDAILNCRIFVPIITSSYGLTLWSLKEIEMAKTLNPQKIIIPVTFLKYWPPLHLCIQLNSTTPIKAIPDNKMPKSGKVKKWKSED